MRLHVSVLLALLVLYTAVIWTRQITSDPALETYVAALAEEVAAGGTTRALDRLDALPLGEKTKQEIALAIGIATYARVLDPIESLRACDLRFSGFCAKGALYTYTTRISAQGATALTKICETAAGDQPACWEAVAYSLTHAALDPNAGMKLATQVCNEAPEALKAHCEVGKTIGINNRAAEQAPVKLLISAPTLVKALTLDDSYVQELFPNFDQPYAKEILTLLQREGAKAALSRYLSNKAGGFNPHRFGHGVGRFLVEQGTEVAEAYAGCSPDPTVGCAHGVVFGYVLGLGKDVLAADVPRICPTVERLYSPVPGIRPSAQCLHGLGHAFTYQQGHGSLPAILERCRPLAQVDRRICWSGGFHSREDIEAGR